MKKYFCFIALFLCFQGYSNKALDLFDAGNKAYSATEFDKAIEMYDSLLSMNYESAALYYNLGNSYFKQKNIGKAILNYERAAQLDPNDEEIQNNLALAKETILDKFETLPSPIFKTLAMSIMTFLSPSHWSVFGLVLLFLMMIGVYLYLFSNFKRPGFVLGLASLALASFCIIMAYSYQSHLENHVPAVILADSSYIKSAPSETAEDVFILHEGTKLEVQDELDGWKKIRLADGKVGWIESGDLEEI